MVTSFPRDLAREFENGDPQRRSAQGNAERYPVREIATPTDVRPGLQQDRKKICDTSRWKFKP
jgi:hypothetical protein